MSVDFTFRPLDHATWQGDGRPSYKSCRFRAPYRDTLELLRRELRHLNVRQAVIEMDLTEGDIRIDGLPRANARYNSPRVRLSFELTDVGPVQYPCDTFSDHQDNIRAIAKTLEAQRAQTRYGATRRNQQYTGWKALPGGSATEVAMTVDIASAVVRRIGGGDPQEIRNSAAEYRTCYRRAVKACHPDTNGDEYTEDFQRLQEAKRILDKHHAA